MISQQPYAKKNRKKKVGDYFGLENSFGIFAMLKR